MINGSTIKQFNTQYSAVALSVMILLSGLGYIPPTKADGFYDDSSLSAGLYFWVRDRDRKDVETGQYMPNMNNSTINSSLDFSSGYAADTFGIELAGYGSVEMNRGTGHPNEIGFNNGKTRWSEDDSGDRSGLSFYKAMVKFKSGDYWGRMGYFQPSELTILRPHWSFLPGTYRGIEAGGGYDFDSKGRLTFAYMWTDEYKAPWFRRMYGFRKATDGMGWMDKDPIETISYLHSIGMKYDFKNDLILETAIGQARGYMDQYFSKLSYSLPVAEQKLALSYQFYGANDRKNDGSRNDVYDGFAWMQAATLGYTTGPIDWRLEGTVVHAEGRQGYFLHRMTHRNASSNGRLDIWWDGRSDFNANGEKALYMGAVYDVGSLAAAMNGFKVGTSYVYGWDAKPSSEAANQQARLRESAWSFDLMYTVAQGPIKDTQIKLHYTLYDNHSNIPSWGGGFNNIFQDERDLKFMIMMPLTIF